MYIWSSVSWTISVLFRAASLAGRTINIQNFIINKAQKTKVNLQTAHTHTHTYMLTKTRGESLYLTMDDITQMILDRINHVILTYVGFGKKSPIYTDG